MDDEAWSEIDASLRRGRRGLPGGSSLARLLAEERGVTEGANPEAPAERLRAWEAEQFGKCPPRLLRGSGQGRAATIRLTTRSDPDVGRRPPRRHWPVASTQLRSRARAPGAEMGGCRIRASGEGYRGLEGGTTLADVLQEHRGVRNKQNLPRLDVEQILAWADAEREATGEYPHANSGPVRGAPGETWRAIDVRPEHGPPRPARRFVAGPAPGGAPRLPRTANRRAHPRLGRRPSRSHWPLADWLVVRAGRGRVRRVVADA